MDAQRIVAPIKNARWDEACLRQALAAARRQAGFGARRLGLSRADRDDLHQDILLAIVERTDRFDARQGCWATFVSLLARHVVADRLRADRCQQR